MCERVCAEVNITIMYINSKYDNNIMIPVAVAVTKLEVPLPSEKICRPSCVS